MLCACGALHKVNAFDFICVHLRSFSFSLFFFFKFFPVSEHGYVHCNGASPSGIDRRLLALCLLIDTTKSYTGKYINHQSKNHNQTE